MRVDRAMNKQEMRRLVCNFVVELVLYGVLVSVYSVVVLRLLGESLARLFGNNLVAYALISLMLIVAQGVLLDIITSFLLDRLRLGRLE
jgi:uncharacterized membrane protein (DUF106 family)